MPASVWKATGIVALLVASIITATFLIMAFWASRTRNPKRRYLKWSFSVHVVVASLLGLLIGEWATDRTPQLDVDELKTLLIPLTMGFSAHALVRAWLADDTGTQWPTRYIPAVLAMLFGIFVAGATTYLGA